MSSRRFLYRKWARRQANGQTLVWERRDRSRDCLLKAWGNVDNQGIQELIPSNSRWGWSLFQLLLSFSEVPLKDEDHVPSPVFLSGPSSKEDHSGFSDSLPMESCTQNAGWVQRRRKEKRVFTLDKHPLLCQRIDRDTSGTSTYSQATVPTIESSTGEDHSCRSKKLLHSGACEMLKLEVEKVTQREQLGDKSQRGREVLARLLAMEERPWLRYISGYGKSQMRERSMPPENSSVIVG